MANVRTNNISVPRTARNKRIYGGNSSTSTSVNSVGATVLDWVSVSDTEVAINRNLTIDGDLTVQNLSGLAGDTVIVNENGTLATVREVINEVPSGLINGVNVTYTLANLPDGLNRLYKNGQKLKLTDDYSITGQTITLVSPLVSDGYTDVLLCDYRYVTYSPGGDPVPAIPDQVAWTAMSKGAAAQESGFNLQACRIGKTIQISGSFQFINGSGVDSVIATVLTPAAGMTLSRRIYAEISEISSNQVNRGIAVYVEPFSPASATLTIKTRAAYEAGMAYLTITILCI